MKIIKTAKFKSKQKNKVLLRKYWKQIYPDAMVDPMLVDRKQYDNKK